LATFTDTDAELVFPARSYTVTASVCAPFATEPDGHAYTQGLAVTVAFVAPSTWKATFHTPTLSVAEAATLTVPATDAPLRGLEIPADGAALSIVTCVPADSGLLFPAPSDTPAFTTYTPSASDDVVADQFPDASTFAPPTPDTPLYSCNDPCGSAVPEKFTVRYEVTPLPTSPDCDHVANTGVDGVAGATVSTRKLNGVTATPACGCSSVPVNTCAPSANRAEVGIHTFAHPSELNVPTAIPSIEIEYFDNPPSPNNKNVGVGDADAVGSHPICKF
jgi:hypothetical protein